MAGVEPRHSNNAVIRVTSSQNENKSRTYVIVTTIVPLTHEKVCCSHNSTSALIAQAFSGLFHEYNINFWIFKLQSNCC